VKVDESPFELGEVGGEGPAVLCLHGLTGTPWEVRPPAEALAGRGFACVGPVLPGHGETPERLAGTHRREWLDAALDAFDRLARTHARVYALGLSMGGLLALSLAARRPVAGLAVLAAPLRLRRLTHLALPLVSPFLSYMPKVPAIRDPQARARHPGYDRMPLAAARELVRFQREVERDLPGIEAPLLLLYSRLDPTVPRANARWIAERAGSPGPQIHYLSRSAHVLPVDLEHREVAERVERFLSGLEEAALTGGRAQP
jgi:carboxylesterase